MSRVIFILLSRSVTLCSRLWDAVVAEECGIPSLNTSSIAQLRDIICWTGAVPMAHTAVQPPTEPLKCDAAPLNPYYAKFISSLVFLEEVFEDVDKVTLLNTRQHVSHRSLLYVWLSNKGHFVLFLRYNTNHCMRSVLIHCM